MGAHHFKLSLVPRGATPSRDEEDWYEGDFLKSFSVPESIIQRLRQIFEKTNHWGDVEEYVSAHDWSGDLRIWHDEGEISDIVFRFAPIADPVEKLRDFTAIAKDAGCLILVGSSEELIEPEFDIVFQALKKHRSFRFLSDPKGAIIEAGRETKQDGKDG